MRILGLVFLSILLVPACKCCPPKVIFMGGPGGSPYAGGGSWPHVSCPPGSPYTANQRLMEIAEWATTANKADVAELANACRAHVGPAAANEEHCSKVYAAWSAAHSAATSTTLSNAQRTALWAMCAGELTHDATGGGRQAAWPDTPCGGEGTAKDLLNEIKTLASPNAAQQGAGAIDFSATIDPLVQTCLVEHAVAGAATEQHCAKVYAAWTLAKMAANTSVGYSQQERVALWSACAGELTHDATGGGVTSGGG
ncbi:MAG: hypothetical protein ACYTGN_01090 [Planctomycetota bacterium]|jgi:hypothetical protein